MPIEEIAEGFLKGIGRFIGRMIIEIVFEVFCYWIGRVFLRIVSFGKYPKDHFGDDSDTICSIVGLGIILAIGGTVIYFINN